MNGRKYLHKCIKYRTNIQDLKYSQTLTTKNSKTPIHKWGEKIEFSYEDIQMANKNTKKYSSSLMIREMQIKTALRENPCQRERHISEYRMLTITKSRMRQTRKSDNSQCWCGCGEKGILMHYWWNCHLVQSLWKTI